MWSFHIKPAGLTGRMREDEAIRIVIGNTMYLASPYGAVIALDATTGAQKWRFELPNNELPSKRGLAYWPGGGDIPLPASIIFGSTTGGLYSLKASDGTPNEWFGENGIVNLKAPEVMHTGAGVGYSLLSSATIYKNLIIIGAGTGEGRAAPAPTPITYLGGDGRQFVAVVSTGGGLTGSQVTSDEIIAFALPKK